MLTITLERGDPREVLANIAADAIVLRGEALARYVEHVRALGMPVDLQGATSMHGVLTQGGRRDWYGGDPP